MPSPVDIVALLAAATALAGVSARLGMSAPLVLTAVGLVASFLPGVPAYPLSPELVLVGFLPPLLYATALRTPVAGLRRNRRPIGLLSVSLVLVTAFAVAGVATAILPGLPVGAAVALGAVVAPPDAVAATAIARRIGMPRRVVTILEGESLLNDATALVTLRTALAAIGGSVSLLSAAGDFVLAVLVGVGVGFGLAAVLTPLRRRVRDPVLDTTGSLLVPYIAYLLAEQLHGSGVLAVVIAGLTLGHRSPQIQSATSRVIEGTLWRSVQFLLEAVIFLLIGLQLRGLLQAASRAKVDDARIALLCVAVTATVIVVRILWTFPASYLPRLLPAVRRAEEASPWQGVALVAWAGMRGVVTLAAALSIDAEGVPQRDALVVAAFAVVAATLLIQGSTLPLLLRVLRVSGTDPAQDALQRALVMQRAADAGLARLEECARPDDPVETVESLRAWGRRLGLAAWERLGAGQQDRETPAQAFGRLRVAMLTAERDVVVQVRRAGSVSHEVVDAVLERLDQEEAMLVGFADNAPAPRGTLTGPVGSGDCEHLRIAPSTAVPRTPGVCQGCLDLGERTWVHLRMCLDCGVVGCCDSSPHRHATGHFETTGHPVMRSVELGEQWRWCYVDDLVG